MIIRLLTAAALSAGLLASGAQAATVINSDKTSHEVTIMPHKGKVHRVAILGQHHRSLDCADGATLKLGTTTASCTAKTGKIYIRSGKFVL